MEIAPGLTSKTTFDRHRIAVAVLTAGALPMTRSCTASASAKPAGCWPRSLRQLGGEDLGREDLW
jgi:hypothetical protein